MKNTSFIFYSTFYESTQCLKGNRRGRFLCKLLEYMSGGDEPTFTEKETMEASLFILMQPQIKANIARREGGQLGAEAGKKGGRPPKKQEEQDGDETAANDNRHAYSNDAPAALCNEPDTTETASNKDATTEQTPDVRDASCDAQNPSNDIRGLSNKTPHPKARGLHCVTPNNNNNENENNNVNEVVSPSEKPDGENTKAETKQTHTIPEQAERLAHLLYDLHRQSDPHFTTSQKHIEQWAKDIEKLSRIDKRSYEDIEKVIRWVKTEGNFWCPNIISGSKLREKYPQVFLQMQQQCTRSPPSGNKQYDCNTTGIQEEIPF